MAGLVEEVTMLLLLLSLPNHPPLPAVTAAAEVAKGPVLQAEQL